MTSGLLVLAIIAGITWADRQAATVDFVEPRGWALATLVAALVATRLAVDIRRQRASPLCRRLGLIMAVVLAFGAGVVALDVQRSRAARDRERAERVAAISTPAMHGLRLADAEVKARRPTAWGTEVELVSVRAADAGPPLPESLLLRLAQHAEGSPAVAAPRSERLLRPGSRVRLGLRVAPLRSARNPGTRDREQAAARRGWAATARLVKPDWVLEWTGLGGGRGQLQGRLASARASLRELVAADFAHAGADRGAGLARALALGDRSGVDAPTREAFRRLGLSHLLAVSGLHVGFVALLAGFLGLRVQTTIGLGLRRGGAFDRALVGACGAALGYAWLTGASLSVERAALLFALFAVCRIARRSPSPSVGLAWVAGLILLRDPGALFDVGAQLSFAACAALVFAGAWQRSGPSTPAARRLAPGIAGLPERLRRGLVTLFQASLAASLGTAPILVQAGLPLAVLSPLVNLAAIPWTGFCVLPTALVAVALAGQIPASWLHALLLPAAALDVMVARAAAIAPAPTTHAIFSFGLVWGIAVLGLAGLRRGRWAAGCLAWVVLALGGGLPISAGVVATMRPQVVYFDVGQGDAALVQGRSGTLLIDTGPGDPGPRGGATLARGLRALGVRSIDVLVVTHADLDHRAGALRVLSEFEVDELWLPQTGVAGDPLSALAERAARAGARVRWLDNREGPLRRGDLDIEVLWPAPMASTSMSTASRPTRNERSLVLRVDLDTTAYLFAADIGARAEQSLLETRRARLDADVLKVAHHGSRRSSGIGFLEAVSPRDAIVSAPCEATRGLPTVEALERLDRSGARLWWTGRDGAVIVARGSEGALALRGWGRPRVCHARGAPSRAP